MVRKIGSMRRGNLILCDTILIVLGVTDMGVFELLKAHMIVIRSKLGKRKRKGPSIQYHQYALVRLFPMNNLLPSDTTD
ncbi:hypothetical protein YC2023_082132 [Brassica napus]